MKSAGLTSRGYPSRVAQSLHIQYRFGDGSSELVVLENIVKTLIPERRHLNLDLGSFSRLTYAKEPTAKISHVVIDGNGLGLDVSIGEKVCNINSHVPISLVGESR